MYRISKHIDYNEATHSMVAKRFGIINEPNEEQLSIMKKTAEKIFEPIREHFGVPIAVTSFFRTKELNKKVGGSRNSQHCNGEAIDIDSHIFGNVSNREIFQYIVDNLEFDQLIWEFGDDNEPDWVHISYTIKRRNRKQILKTKKKGGIEEFYS